MGSAREVRYGRRASALHRPISPPGFAALHRFTVHESLAASRLGSSASKWNLSVPRREQEKTAKTLSCRFSCDVFGRFTRALLVEKAETGHGNGIPSDRDLDDLQLSGLTD